MLLHNQKSMYHMDDVEKTNLTDMVLVAINEVTKFNPEIRMVAATISVWILQTFHRLIHT